MYECLQLLNFRGFSDFSMELKPITLISGKNNTGKSSLLESVFLFQDYATPDVFPKLLGFRGIRDVGWTPKTLWEPLFHKGDLGTPVRISLGFDNFMSLEKNTTFVMSNTVPSNGSNKKREQSANYTLTCSFKRGNHEFVGDYFFNNGLVLQNRVDTPILPNVEFMQYLGPNIILSEVEVAERLGQMELSNSKERAVEVLQIIDKSITDITTIASDGHVHLYITKCDGTKLPFHAVGDGAKKIFHIALTMLARPESIILLDEVENGIHYSVLTKFWEVIGKIAKSENCQIIATTHSYECIVSAMEGVEGACMQDSFLFTRLDKSEEGQIAAKSFSHKMLKSAVSSDWEVR